MNMFKRRKGDQIKIKWGVLIRCFELIAWVAETQSSSWHYFIREDSTSSMFSVHPASCLCDHAASCCWPPRSVQPAGIRESVFRNSGTIEGVSLDSDGPWNSQKVTYISSLSTPNIFIYSYYKNIYIYSYLRFLY
jgi:hypothetical protein